MQHDRLTVSISRPCRPEYQIQTLVAPSDSMPVWSHRVGGMGCSCEVGLRPDFTDTGSDSVCLLSRLQKTRYADSVARTVLLIMAPTPLVASNFMIFSRIVARGGQQFSRLSPRRCKSFSLGSILSGRCR